MIDKKVGESIAQINVQDIAKFEPMPSLQVGISKLRFKHPDTGIICYVEVAAPKHVAAALHESGFFVTLNWTKSVLQKRREEQFLAAQNAEPTLSEEADPEEVPADVVPERTIN